MEKSELVQITRQRKIAAEDFGAMINAIYEQIWQNLLPPQILTEDLTSVRANNVVTPPDAPVPDCQTCGACCGALPSVGVRTDELISEDDFWDVTVKGETDDIVIDRFLRRNSENFACTALEGNLGEKVSCRIYERRPHVCHLFEAGSDRCRALRRAYGFEPFLSLSEMFEAVQKIDARPKRRESAESIINVKFSVQAETGSVEIKVLLKDGSIKTIHVFDPHKETWRQFEFDGLTLREAKDLIASRNENKASV